MSTVLSIFIQWKEDRPAEQVVDLLVPIVNGHPYTDEMHATLPHFNGTRIMIGVSHGGPSLPNENLNYALAIAILKTQGSRLSFVQGRLSGARAEFVGRAGSRIAAERATGLLDNEFVSNPGCRQQGGLSNNIIL